MKHEVGPTFFEDMPIGATRESARAITLTREAIIGFASEYDPQPAHLGDVEAATSPFGELVASGWQTAAVAMRLTTETLWAPGGFIGAGVELRWLAPVRPDDALRARFTVLEARLSASKPGWGLIRFKTEAINQDGAVVMVTTSSVMVPCRPTREE